MFITAQGKILPCEKIGHQYALGHILDNEVDLDTNKIAKRYNSWFSSLEKQCSLCSLKKGCVQCIFNIDNFEQKAVCPNIMKEDNFQNYVSSQYNHLRQFPHLYKDIMENSIIE